MKKTKIADLSELTLLKPAGALVANVDLVLIRYSEDKVSVLYGRCHHRGALLADGYIDGENLICGVHGWDYRYDSGISEYANDQALKKFQSWVEGSTIYVDEDEIALWEKENPQAYDRNDYLGQYQEIHQNIEEPFTAQIQSLAKHGLSKVGHHGPVAAMGVLRSELPRWEDLQIQTAQLATLPLSDQAKVKTQLVIGPSAKKPLVLDIPLFVSDMSFGALSKEAKTALSMGAEKSGTAICSGEGGMLPEESAANSRYMYELASAKFGFQMELMERCRPFILRLAKGQRQALAVTYLEPR